MCARAGRLAAAALVAVSCASCTSSRQGRGVPPPRPAPAPASSLTTELSFAFNSTPPGNWNPLSAGASGDGLTAVADQVFPSVYTFGPSFNPTLNTTLVQSVTETSQSPQTLVYRINPKAVWSDGVPITGTDFVYNWQAQAGKGTDVGGKPFTPASATGYNVVQSVTVSPSSPDEVTVTFSSPYPDWTSLFRHVIPAHVGTRIGFNSGFTDPVADLISGGPYVVTAYDPSGFLRLARNPTYPGPPAATLELDLRFVPDWQQLSSALVAGQVGCAEAPATELALFPLRSSKSLNVMVAPGPQYLDLEFQQTTGPMKSESLRAAVTAAISRPSVIAATVAGAAPGEAPLANRFLVPNEAGYSPHGPPATGATSRPGTSALTLGADPADPLASAAAQSISQQLKLAGFSVGVTGLSGQWDLAVRDHAVSPFPGESMPAYLSGSSSNVDGVSDPNLDTAIDEAVAAQDGQRPTLVNQADLAAWGSYADLPIAAIPQAVVCQTYVTGVAPNPSPDGLGYDAAGWGIAAGGP